MCIDSGQIGSEKREQVAEMGMPGISSELSNQVTYSSSHGSKQGWRKGTSGLLY